MCVEGFFFGFDFVCFLYRFDVLWVFAVMGLCWCLIDVFSLFSVLCWDMLFFIQLCNAFGCVCFVSLAALEWMLL